MERSGGGARRRDRRYPQVRVSMLFKDLIPPENEREMGQTRQSEASGGESGDDDNRLEKEGKSGMKTCGSPPGGGGIAHDP
jgi:hypothetical protein